MSNENEHLAPEADVNEAPAASAEAPEELGAILRSGDRTAAGPTVPAGGLYMTRLWYETPEVSFHVE